MNISELSNQLELREGVWFASSMKQKISYPDDGNEVAYQLESKSFWFKHRNNCLISSLKNFPPTGTLVDVGGGNGFVACSLLKAGFDTCLLEPSIQGVQYAQQRGLKKIICATLENSGLSSNSISAIGLFDVLEHIEDDPAFLDQVNSTLQKQGRLYLTVPTHSVLWSASDVLAEHYRRYSLKNIQKLIKQAGFQIDYATYFFAPLFLPVLFALAIPTKLGLLKPVYKAKKYETLHGTNERKGMYQLLNKIWQWEIKQISQQKQLPFGTSCLVIASKK